MSDSSLNLQLNRDRFEISEAFLEKYNRPGPRYTSYPTAPVWQDNFGADDLEQFYASYRVFAEFLRNSRYQLRLRLRDGDLVAFDNRRILHGRTAFSSARSLRHLQGCYLTRDSVYSEAAMLHRKLADERRA